MLASFLTTSRSRPRLRAGGWGAALAALVLGLAGPALGQSKADPGAGEDPPEAGEAALPPEPPSTTRIACLDDTSEDGSPRKGVQQRDFIKRHRFELGA